MNRESPVSLDRANTDSLLAEALIGQRKYAEAERLLLAGYERMKQLKVKAPPSSKSDLIETLERLARLYEATGNKDEAAKWRKELEEVKKTTLKKEVKP